jgi:hypothetical protein
MEIFGIYDLSKVNIVCDRGSNFLKAFRHLNPITCSGHRLNNIVKISFFQHQKQSPTSSAVDIQNNSSSDDEVDESIHVPSKPVKKRKKSNIRMNVVEEKATKIKLIDAPLAVQQLIKTIVDCKSLTRYIKKVNAKISFSET